MATLFFTVLWIYACISLEIVQEINDCLETFATSDATDCVISLDPSISHTITGTINSNVTNITSRTPVIVINSTNTLQPASILVHTSLQFTLHHYGLDITFNNVILDGSPNTPSSNFLQIYTNQTTQINIHNSRMIHFNSSMSPIHIEETINSFTVDSNIDGNKVLSINVDVRDINRTNAFVSIHFENSTFADNTNTASNGGVLSLIGHEFQLEINNCNFTNNQVTGWRKKGGCISWDRSSIPDPLSTQIEDSKPTDTTTYGNITGPYYHHYNLTEGASDTWVIASRVDILHSVFTNNNAADAGGVLFIIQPQVYDAQIFTIQTLEEDPNTNMSDTITGNLSIIRDFELYSDNNLFYRNTAGQYGGVYRHWGYTQIQDEFSSQLVCDDRHYQITIMNDVFTENYIPPQDDQSFAYGATLSTTCGQVTVENTDFRGNSAKYGSAMSIYASSEVRIDRCEFEDNNCTFGTVYINGLLRDEYDVCITNSHFVNNRAENDGAGVLAIVVSEVVVDQCHFEGNYNVYGGTVSVNYFQNFNPMHVEITQSQFISNTVDSDDVVSGGAISAIRYDYEQDVYPLNCYQNDTAFDSSIEGLTLEIDACQFEDNSESAIGLSTVSAYISRCIFRNNTNTISHGGAIKSVYSWFTVNDSRFISNTAAETGGAISTGTLTYTQQYSDWQLPAEQPDNQLCEIAVVGSVFESNTAELGGAIWIGHMVEIENNAFTNNKAQYGGAVAVSASGMTIRENEFMNNSAEVHGGCLFQTQYSNEELSTVSSISLQVHYNTFQSCSAFSGGAIFLRTQRNQAVKIKNNRFMDNSAESVAGALAIGQLLPISIAMDGDDTMDTMNIFQNNSAANGFDDYVSYPDEMYILAETSSRSVSPGISTSCALGAYDLFGQNFESFMVTDWNAKEENFEFYLGHDAAFELLTVNSGSLSAGKANISFLVRTGNATTIPITYLGSNTPNLISKYNVSWQLVECPTGYGYNESAQTCHLCQRDTFKVKDGWTQCLPCLIGLSCRGGEHVQILYKNWWASNYSSSKETFFCRLGECCTRQDGCSPESSERCPDDRDAESIGCGKCVKGLSAMHGSHVCSDCSHLSHGQLYTGALIAFVLWPVILVFLFGLAKYDETNEAGNLCKAFYSVSIIEITVIVLIDYYQSLPAILTFVPDAGTYFLINLFFARIPVTDNGFCLFHGMTILQRTYWDLLIPSIILILSFVIFAVSYCINTRNREPDTDTDDGSTPGAGHGRINLFKLGCGWVYDPLRGIMFSLFFCIIPMLWSCSHLFKCIDYGSRSVFWNAPGEECKGYIVALMALLFVALSLIYIIANIYYSNSHLIKHEDIQNNKRLIPLYLQRVQPFYFMVYPFTDKNTRRASKIAQTQNLTWQNIYFRGEQDFKYLYVGWISPFLRKITCLIAHATITGAKGQSDQTFIVTNLTLATLVLYQLFSQDYTSIDNYTLHLYCMYLLYWLVLLIVSGSTKIISENMDTMQSLKMIVNVIMWIPLVCAFIAIGWAVLLLCKPELLARTQTVKTKRDIEFDKAKTMNSAFSSAVSVMGPASDDNKELSRSEVP